MVLSKIYLAIGGVVFAAMLGVTGVLYWQNSSLTADNEILTANNATLAAANDIQKTTIQVQKSAIDSWENAMDGFAATMEELSAVQREAAAETRRLNDVFSKHDLDALSLAKPGLIERVINRGTADVLGVFERETAGDIHDERGDQGTPEAATGTEPAAD